MSVSELYRKRTIAGGCGFKGSATGIALRHAITELLAFVLQSSSVELNSKVHDKEYVMASHNGRYSRPINRSLFKPKMAPDKLLSVIFNAKPPFDAAELDQCLYTAAMSYPVANDLEKDGDKKSPGTYFEILIGHLVAARYGINPIKANRHSNSG